MKNWYERKKQGLDELSFSMAQMQLRTAAVLIIFLE